MREGGREEGREGGREGGREESVSLISNAEKTYHHLTWTVVVM